MKIQSLAGLAAAMTLVVAGPANAQTDHNGAGTVQVAAVSNFTSFFDDLSGMKVSWTTTTGACSTGCSGLWGHISGNEWGVVGTGFSLTAEGNQDTYGDPLGFDPYTWDLKGTNLTGFSIDPTSASAVFDNTNPPVVGTTGSSFGHPFQFGGFCFIICFQGTDEWNTTATYSNEVGVGGNAPVGDLWAGLSVSFGDTFGKTTTVGRRTVGGPDEVDFSQDLDLVDGGNGLNFPQSATPEPGTMAMLATGLVGIAGAGMRRRKR